MKWSVILVIVASLSFIAAAKAESALEYGSYCRPYEKPEMRGDRVYVTPNYEIGLCWGAFAGMQTLFSMTSGGKHMLLACVQPKSTRVQLIQIFLRYLSQYPEVGHEDFVVVTHRALMKTFPCR